METIAAELTWFFVLLRDLGIVLTKAPSLHCDNLNALQVPHAKANHIELDYNHLHERVDFGSLGTWYVTFLDQIAYIFTKLVMKFPFEILRRKLDLYYVWRSCLIGSENVIQDYGL